MLWRRVVPPWRAEICHYFTATNQRRLRILPCTPGKEAVLTIYEDGTEKEKVHLYSLQTKEEMHALFREKGFQKKSSAVLMEEKRMQVVEKQLEREDQFRPMFSNIFVMYGVMGLMTCIFVVMIQRRGAKQRRAMKLPIRVQV